MFKKILQKYQEEFKQCLNDLKHKETFYKQIPNLITITRPLGMIPANILFFTGHHLAAIILTGILLSTDFIDGKLARKWKVESKLGADLDAVGDKLIFLGMALPLVISNQLFLLNVLLEAAISYINVKGRLNELDTKTVYSGKVKTCFLSTTLLTGYLVEIFNLPHFLFQSLIISTFLTQTIAMQEYTSNYEKMKINSEQNHSKEDKTKEKDEQNTKKLNSKQELIKEREFLLSLKEPNKETKNKKKVRKK